jgi:translation initiation factor 6 (eIF-6)
MVKIIDYKQHENAAGKTFFSLILQGGISMVQSQETGMYYATTHNASVTSTFDEKTCQSLIGHEMPGKVVKVKCEPFEYALPTTGELVTLNSRWVYMPEEATEEQLVFEEKVERPLAF